MPPRESLQRPLGHIVDSMFAILRNRVELAGIELAEEKERLLAILFVGVAAMLLGTVALVTLTALVAVLFWDSYRWQSLAVLFAILARALTTLLSRSKRPSRNSKRTASCSGRHSALSTRVIHERVQFRVVRRRTGPCA
jgi:uncharacterized membrane protein YqjE